MLVCLLLFFYRERNCNANYTFQTKVLQYLLFIEMCFLAPVRQNLDFVHEDFSNVIIAPCF